jgi:hypothetical protein
MFRIEREIRPTKRSSIPLLCALGILANLFFSPGGAALAEWSWSDQIVDLSVAGRIAHNPAAAVDASGNVTVVWGFDNSNENTILQGNRFITGWRGVVDIEGTGSNWQPRAVAEPAGAVTVVWESKTGEQWAVRAARFRDGSWSGPISLSAPGPDARSPAVAVDASGNVTAVWQHGSTIQSARSIDGDWNGVVDLGDAGAGTAFPQVAADANGNVTAVWARAGDSGVTIQSARFSEGYWAAPVEISVPGKDARRPNVATDSNGNVTVVWELASGTIQSARFSAGAWTVPVNLSDAGTLAAKAQLVVDGSDNVTAVWGAKVGTDLIIQSARFDKEGWSSAVDIGVAGKVQTWGERGFPAAKVASDRAGTATVVWERVDDRGVSVQSARYASGSWGGVTQLAEAGTASAFPQVVADDAGNVTAVWLNSGIVQSKRGSDNRQPRTYTVTVAKSGEGTVTSSPEGIDCGTVCNAAFEEGSYVFLFAKPASGQVIGGWSGDCGQWIGPLKESCTLTMKSNKTVSVSFRPASAKTETLQLIKKGKGTGTIHSEPAGLSCREDCRATVASFEKGAQVVLTAAAGEGSRFRGWSGACSGKKTTCVLKMGQSKRVGAKFDAYPRN